MTKAVGAVAAAILVERGAIGWDEPAGAAIPAFDALPVLDGWDGDTPRLRPQRTRATLRHLVTHASGAAYDIWHPEHRPLQRRPALPEPAQRPPPRPRPAARLRSRHRLGLRHRPRLGRPADRGGRRPPARRLRPRRDPRAPRHGRHRLRAPRPPPRPPRRRAPPHRRRHPPPRRPSGLPAPSSGASATRSAAPAPTTCASCACSSTAARSTAPASSPPRWPTRSLPAAPAPSARCRPSTRPPAPTVTRFGPASHSLLGVRAEAAIPGRRSAGAQGWAGLYNTHWWLDPARGRAGLFLTQLPPVLGPAGDGRLRRLRTRRP